MSERIPNTCAIAQISRHPYLIQNRLFLKFILPQANEVAQLSSPSKSYLKDLLKVPAIRDRAS